MRIVSLCPSITESLVALGLGGSLVGVTRYCVHPREALEGIPRVGGTKNPDLAAIAALEPDLVFCDGHGVVHERGCGLASHVGVLLGVPTIGVPKTPFHAVDHPPGPHRTPSRRNRWGQREAATKQRRLAHLARAPQKGRPPSRQAQVEEAFEMSHFRSQFPFG